MQVEDAVSVDHASSGGGGSDVRNGLAISIQNDFLRGNAGGKREAKLVAADQHGAAAAASKVSVLEWHEGGVGTTGSMNRHLMIVMFAFALMA